MDKDSVITESSVLVSDGILHVTDNLIIPDDIEPLLPRNCNGQKFSNVSKWFVWTVRPTQLGKVGKYGAKNTSITSTNIENLAMKTLCFQVLISVKYMIMILCSILTLRKSKCHLHYLTDFRIKSRQVFLLTSKCYRSRWDTSWLKLNHIETCALPICIMVLFIMIVSNIAGSGILENGTFRLVCSSDMLAHKVFLLFQ